ncbi:DUF202 domain-containing protein [Pseudarthrobacter psychrotolerans]|uniref:DUF202 domain-containing protein n=1 Tax=Pseudarthrobacter psychrotolerans TaxID=2697569 RepID=A0A6P1NXI5_9MICC|nr:DUF202 domain-containing protein [Pseudarthrobacter psychrotolerans]
MAWGRTLLALLTVSALFLRWLPSHGPVVSALIAAAAVTAGGIFATQRIRYRRSSRGINAENLHADVGGVFALSAGVVLLGAFSLIAAFTF